MATKRILPTRQSPEGRCANMFTELSAEQLQAVNSSARVRGLYKLALDKFVESGKAGVQVDLTEGEFAGKATDTVYQGFAGQIRTEAYKEKVRLIRQEDNLYLVSLATA